MILGAEVMGFNVGQPGIAAVIILIAVLLFLASRTGGGLQAEGAGRGRGSSVTGAGDMQNCKRCSAEYQIETIELLPNGNTRRQRDERCPQCGWALSWGEPDN